MFIRGSGSGQEYRRIDNSFFRGVVVKNNDPLRLDRVKVFIPELTNQPLDNWIDEFDSINVKIPGINNIGDNWMDVKIFEEICNMIPWAEPSFPIFGEGSNARYYKDGQICTITDANYLSAFRVNDTDSITLTQGSFSPAFLYENETTVLGDAFSNPTATYSVKCNPYSFNYRPSKHVNKSKGIFGVPEVGTKVWVFHYEGDLNFPVYCGISHDYRELTVVNDTDNKNQLSPTYPSDFEN